MTQQTMVTVACIFVSTLVLGFLIVWLKPDASAQPTTGPDLGVLQVALEESRATARDAAKDLADVRMEQARTAAQQVVAEDRVKKLEELLDAERANVERSEDAEAEALAVADECKEAMEEAQAALVKSRHAVAELARGFLGGMREALNRARQDHSGRECQRDRAHMAHVYALKVARTHEEIGGTEITEREVGEEANRAWSVYEDLIREK